MPCAWLAWAILLLCGAAGAWASPIYLTQPRPQGLPVYTDQPLSLRSRLLIDLPGAEAPDESLLLARAPEGTADREQERAEPLVPAALVAPAVTWSARVPRMASVRPAPLNAVLARRSLLLPLIERVGKRHGVRHALLQAVIDVESGFRADVRSPKGAVGLMQLMPATAARYGRFDLTVAAQNLDVGARHLRELIDRFEGDVELALAAYNAGEGAVAKYGNRIPPYAETRAYVDAVVARYGHYSRMAATPRGDE